MKMNKQKEVIVEISLITISILAIMTIATLIILNH